MVRPNSTDCTNLCCILHSSPFSLYSKFRKLHLHISDCAQTVRAGRPGAGRVCEGLESRGALNTSEVNQILKFLIHSCLMFLRLSREFCAKSFGPMQCIKPSFHSDSRCCRCRGPSSKSCQSDQTAKKTQACPNKASHPVKANIMSFVVGTHG